MDVHMLLRIYLILTTLLLTSNVSAMNEVEPTNDDWETATFLAANTPVTGTQTNDDDWYEISVPVGSLRLLIEVVFTHADGNMTMVLYEDGNAPGSFIPGALVGSASSATDNEFIDKVTIDAGKKYIVVRNGTGGNQGNSYVLTWSSLPAGSDDTSEQNDDLANPAASTEDVTIFGIQSDEDWYQVSVSPNSSQLEVNLTFLDSTATSNSANIDMELYDKDGNFVASSITANDNESIVQTGLTEGHYNLRIFGDNNGNGYALVWVDTTSASSDTTSEPSGGGSSGAFSLSFLVIFLLSGLVGLARQKKT
jgi:hypothetical protein